MSPHLNGQAHATRVPRRRFWLSLVLWLVALPAICSALLRTSHFQITNVAVLIAASWLLTVGWVVHGYRTRGWGYRALVAFCSSVAFFACFALGALAVGALL